jgi:hypothetical protein
MRQSTAYQLYRELIVSGERPKASPMIKRRLFTENYIRQGSARFGDLKAYLLFNSSNDTFELRIRYLNIRACRISQIKTNFEQYPQHKECLESIIEDQIKESYAR